ncbi:triple tyrosine motif-containing protein [Pontibacter virosus]|uniref:YXYXY domain-containing protein n=1 Tax=Pontibacter virosus TaxID=1765052 RepID=A0A2U1AZ54_9BACT|nr:triple tyrosine motif-containing protein [Pontibacter virosus]PVY41714.1 YXYXY domain-containing protein [Pontibacter virosus]
MKRFAFIFLLFLFLCHSIFAQVKGEGVPYIKNYSLKEYQASPQNWAVVQDHRGIMYFGNNYGVLEFDGNHWRRLGLPNRSTVHSLAVNKEGRVYVGGQDEFGYLRPDDSGVMAYVSLKPLINSDDKSFADVWNIFTKDDEVFFCTVSGVYHFDGDSVEVYKTPYEPTGFPFYVQGRLLVPVLGQGIYELKDRRLVRIPGSEQISAYNIASILPYPGGKALILTEERGVYIYDGYNGFSQSHWPVEEFLIRNKVNTATALTEGYAIGTLLNGLVVIDMDGRPTQHLNSSKGLQNSTVRSIYQDHKENLWLALNYGIDYVEVNSPFKVFNGRLGLPGTGYASLVNQSTLYLGTSDGLFYKPIDDDENPLNPLPLKRVDNTEGQVYNLQEIGGKIILSHHNGPFELVDNKAVRLAEHRGAWLFLPLKSRPGYYICGTYHGLMLYKMIAGKLVFQNRLAGFDESSRVMEEDSEGNIWVAHGYIGLFKLKLSEDLQKVAQATFYGEKDGLPSNLGINVYKINGKLVFTGLHGVYVYNNRTDRFELYEELNKLFSPNVQVRKLVEDKEGNIWFSAGDEMGLIRKLSNGSYEVIKNVFNKLEGKLVGGFEHIAYYNNQNVLIGIDEGFVQYQPNFLQKNSLQEKFYTLIRQVEVRKQASDSLIYGGSFVNNSLIDNTQLVHSIPTLPYALNSLKFTFGAILYEGIDDVQYRYFLEGFDADWSSWGGTLQKEYTNLREGTYTFRVKARNVYNQESEEAAYTFTVAPPWYRSVWAYAIYLLLGLLLAYFIWKIMDRRVHLAKIKLQQEQEKALRLQEAQHTEEVLKAEKEIIRLNNEKLESELNHKTQELTSSALHVMQNMEAVHKVKEQLQRLMDEVNEKETRLQLRKILRAVEEEIKIENNWEQFESHFNQVHQDFLKRLSIDYPELTHKDLKMCAYLRLNLSSKDIASLLKLSLRGVETSRYRIRKKMNLEQEENLTDVIMRY